MRLLGRRRTAGRRVGWTLLLGVMLGLPAMGVGAILLQEDYTSEPINYLKTPPDDAIPTLQRKLDQGEVKLKFDSKHGYLLSVLQQLHVPVSSQMLVFSKTSFQHDRISPHTPRALYFNDRVYIGWVQEGEYLEVASVDPQLGAVFYVLPQQESATPKFVRQTYECLQCHDSNRAGNVPGHIMRSVYPDRQGNPILPAGTYVTSDQSPLRERWGGWYVTGRHGAQTHLGNMVAQSDSAPEQTDWSRGANVTDLSKFLDVTPYLSRHSDIVALMVAEHQTQIQNLITRANYETRRALQYEKLLNRDLGRPGDYHSESTRSRIRNVSEKLVRALLFVGEARLTAPVTGTSNFAAQFATFGPFDKQKRSLRDFDLKQRLFRYPCSYQVYSAAFQGLPDEAKAVVYSRFEEILTGQEKSPDFAHLSEADRKAILEILHDTDKDFAGWEARH